MAIRELLAQYYGGLSKKNGWESTIAADFRFYGVGGKSVVEQGTKGKHAYIAVIKRFSQSFESVTVRDMLVEGDNAYVTATYVLRSLHGNTLPFDIVEHWTVQAGTLKSLVIYYDTVSYNGFIVNGR